MTHRGPFQPQTFCDSVTHQAPRGQSTVSLHSGQDDQPHTAPLTEHLRGVQQLQQVASSLGFVCGKASVRVPHAQQLPREAERAWDWLTGSTTPACPQASCEGQSQSHKSTGLADSPSAKPY